MNRITKGPLAEHISRYIAHKRSLGKQLKKPEPLLYLLDRYLQTRSVTEIDQITPQHVDEFVAARQRRTPRSYNVLLCYLRGLFDWMVAHELLRTSPLCCERRRIIPMRRPFLFNPEQARRLFEAARLLPSTPRARNRGEIYRIIFALLYGLGLRVGEVSRLLRKDLDLETRVVTICKTKFGKDRLVPFGPKMAKALTEFLQNEESRFGPIPSDSPLFSFTKKKRTSIGTGTISSTFRKLLPALQLTVTSDMRPPHLHCLRHSFAVGTLLRWYREGIDPMARLFDLSTFLGHVSPSSTSVYLTITTELLECASQRFAHYAEGSRKESAR